MKYLVVLCTVRYIDLSVTRTRHRRLELKNNKRRTVEKERDALFILHYQMATVCAGISVRKLLIGRRRYNNIII